MWIFVCGLAIAGPPSSVVLETGDVLATVSVGLTPAEALAKLADPVWVSQVDGQGTVVTVTGRDGDCLLADYSSPSTFMTATYTVRQCPTADGYESTMVTANAFRSYRARWTVVPEGSGSLLSYRITLTSKLLVPSFVIDRVTRGGLLSLMQAMGARFPP